MITRRVRAVSTISALVVVAAALFARNEYMKAAAAETYAAWKEARLEEMRGEETTWLNLAGLFWVNEGVHSFGSGANNAFVVKEGDAPADIGRFIREGDLVYFEPAAGAGVKHGDRPVTGRIALQDDMGSESPEATVLSVGALRWWIIARDGMLGVRVRNLESPAWKAFEGIQSFTFDHAWRVGAQFLAFETPREMEYPTILGTTRMEEAPGVLVFKVAGQQFEMIPFERAEGTKLWLVFGDRTNGASTYSGGRFLYVDWPDETGRTVIDFNRAYNPPCAFSDYSTCPQPLPQNRLPIEIDAGELVYEKSVSNDP